MGVSGCNHYRSISLPSRLIHPNKVENKLQKHFSNNNLCQTVPITSEAIQSGLQRLVELYSSLEEENTQCQSAQRSIFPVDRDHDLKSMEESLEWSIGVLDCCTGIRESVAMIRESVQFLQSSLRRRGVGPTAVEDDMRKYSCFRKRMNKTIAKGIKTLRNLEKCRNRVLMSEVAGFTVVIMRSVLVFLSWPATKSGPSNLVSRLVQMKSMALGRDNGGKNVDFETLHESLKSFEAVLEGIEVGLESLFRQLLRSRVVLLNCLTHHLR